MKVIVTGLNGTLAPALQKSLINRGFTVIPWNRKLIPPEDQSACQDFLDQQGADGICHLALGSEHWASFLAQYCHDHQQRFLFTSTAMVFDKASGGPHHVLDERDSRDDYGRYKIRCEDLIWQHSKSAVIARIGWQIGIKRGGNQMLEALHCMAESGSIKPSTTWIPACSFMTDTAEALCSLFLGRDSGTFHLDSNAHRAMNFSQIVQALKLAYNKDWLIEENQDYTHDQRLIDDRINMPSLLTRLQSLGS